MGAGLVSAGGQNATFQKPAPVKHGKPKRAGKNSRGHKLAYAFDEANVKVPKSCCISYSASGQIPESLLALYQGLLV